MLYFQKADYTPLPQVMGNTLCTMYMNVYVQKRYKFRNIS